MSTKETHSERRTRDDHSDDHAAGRTDARITERNVSRSVDGANGALAARRRALRTAERAVPETSLTEKLSFKARNVASELSPFHGADRHQPDPGRNYFRFDAADTSVEFYGQGIGERMMIHQFGRAFVDYLAEHGDPGLGKVVLGMGGSGSAIYLDEGDVNLYWLYSFGRFDDAPELFFEEYYLDRTTVDPDVVLCPSEALLDIAADAGFDTLYFPLASYGFFPLGLEREGIGFAGAKGLKGKEKEQRFIGPYVDRPNFEWVDDLVTPDQLNLWYNTKLVSLGTTLEGQRQLGTVNSRVFETLAAGTPFVAERQDNLEDVLGFEFPYQASTSEESLALVEGIEADPEAALAEFAGYGEQVRANHSYTNRVTTLVDYLS